MRPREPGNSQHTAASRRAALVAYGEARVSRRDVSEAFGEDISFGKLLMLLGAENLPLPRYPSDPDSPGRILLRAVLAGLKAGAKC